MIAQQAIFEESSSKYYFLEYSVHTDSELDSIKSAISASLADLLSSVCVVVGFGCQLWQKLNPGMLPEGLKHFETINGVNGFSAPSTQGDVFFWIHSQCHDDNFDAVLKIQNEMSKVAELEVDLSGFTYHDSRDLIGFVDGTANPKGDAQKLAALIPEGKPGAGGSFVLSQKWVHDLEAFNAISQTEQEQVVGRAKEDSIELVGDAMPHNSHVSRTDLKFNGKPAKIYRRSAPFGNACEHGLYFLAFSCEIERFEIQLGSMYGLTGDGVHDRILEFSKVATSSYWFAPSQQDLEEALK